MNNKILLISLVVFVIVISYAGDADGKKHKEQKRCKKEFKKCMRGKTATVDSCNDQTKTNLNCPAHKPHAHSDKNKPHKSHHKNKSSGTATMMTTATPTRVRRGIVGVALKDPHAITTEKSYDHSKGGIQVKSEDFREVVDVQKDLKVGKVLQP